MKNKSKIITLIALAVVVLIAGGWFLVRSTHPTISTSKTSTQQETKDEFTGTWRGEGTYKQGGGWFVTYTFKNGSYTMTTDSSVKDNGTYIITKRFEDGSIEIAKTSVVFNQTFDVFNTFADNGNTLIIEGMKLKKQ